MLTKLIMVVISQSILIRNPFINLKLILCFMSFVPQLKQKANYSLVWFHYTLLPHKNIMYGDDIKIILIDVIFRAQFSAQLMQRFRLYPYTWIASPSITILHHRGTFVAVDEPALTDYIQSLLFTWFNVVLCIWRICIMTCIQYHIMHSGFIALKVLCDPPIHPFLASPDLMPLFCPQFCLLWIVI